jgi:hypothetical protein
MEQRSLVNRVLTLMNATTTAETGALGKRFTEKKWSKDYSYQNY